MSSLFIELQSDEETFCKIIENFSQNFLVEKNSDEIVENQDEVDEFQEKALKLGEDNDQVNLYKYFFSFKEQIFSKDFRVVSSLFVVFSHVLQQQSSNDKKVLLNLYKNTVNEQESLSCSQKLKLLGILLKSFDPSEEEQASLLKEIINIAGKFKRFGLVSPTIKNIEQSFTKWNLSEQSKIELFKSIIENIQNEREKVEFTMRFLISISDMSKDSLNSEQTYIKKCLLILLNYEEYNSLFDNLLDLKATLSIKEKETDLYNVLSFFVKGQLNEYNQWSQSKKLFLKNQGIDEDKYITRLRMGVMANIGEKSKSVTFKEISQHLGVSIDEVEYWVIMAISNNVITAKIDEYEQIIQIQDNQAKYFENDDWANIDVKLTKLIGSFENYVENMDKA